MKIRDRHNSDGMALIMVMCAIFVLSALAAGFALSMKVEARLAQNANSDQQLLWLGRSGVEYCRWVLAQEKCPYDSLNQVWAGGSGSDCDTNLVVENPVHAGDGTFSWKIFDLERRANINTASDALIQQALTIMRRDPNDISVVSDSILDWIDTDDLPRVAGAESDYYQGLPVPYYAKNAPMDDLSELLLIKGIMDHPEIYTGSAATNYEPAPFQHKLGFAKPSDQNLDFPGLTNFFTPFSNGKVNINTADTNVLQMVLGGDAAMADTIVQQRAGPDGVDGTEDDLPYQDATQFGALCDVHSYTYEVHVTAQIGDSKREYVAILARTSATDIQVVSFYWK